MDSNADFAQVIKLKNIWAHVNKNHGNILKPQDFFGTFPDTVHSTIAKKLVWRQKIKSLTLLFLTFSDQDIKMS